MRTRIEVPSLVHGVSQLPAPMRAPAHAESEVNCWPTAEHGLTKRPPLHHGARVLAGSFGSSAVTGKIDRGTDEQYIFLAKNYDAAGSGLGAMTIFDLSGNVYLIQDNLTHTSASTFAYLGLNTVDVAAGLLTKSAENLRSLSVFDSTYIVNRRQSPTMNGSTFTASRPLGHAYVVIAAPAYGAKYTIALRVEGVDLGGGVGVERTVYVNTHDATGTPLGALNSTGEGFQLWDYSQTDYPGFGGAFNASAKTQDVAHLFHEKLTGAFQPAVGGLSVYGNTVTAGLLTVSRQGNVLKVEVGLHATGSITFTGLPNDGGKIRLSDGVNPAVDFEFDNNSSVVQTNTLRQVVIGATAALTNAALITAINAAPALAITATLGTGTVTNLTNDNVGTAGNIAITEPSAVANVTETGMSGGTAAADFASFKVTANLGDTYAYSVWNEIDSYARLPIYCTHNYVVKVKGAVSGTEDDFYVKFVADEGSGQFGKGDWSECAASADPASPSAFPIAMSDVTTPHKLVRLTDDNLGTVTGTAFKRFFTFDPVTWDQIVAGDVDSNPKSVAIDSSRYIQDIVEFEDRVCWLYEDGLLVSEQGEHLNYFRTTVRSIKDSDPIDTKFTADQSGTFHAAVPFAGQLVIFGKESQVAFHGSPVLTPLTYEATQVSKNGNVTTARPAAFRDGVMFGMDFGTYIGIGYLTPSGSDPNVFNSTDLTQHVSAFITAPLRQVEINANSSIVAVLGGTVDTIYVLKQHREGDEVTQSAWFSFKIDDVTTILGMHFFGTKLYIVVQRTEGVFLEYIDLSPGIDDGGRSYWLYLDRRVTNTTSGVSIAAGATTTITMPYDIEVGAVYEVVTIANLTRYTATRTAARTMTVPVNLTGLAFVAGKKYACTHNFHKPQIMEDARTGQRLILDQSSSVIQLAIRYENTSYLELVVGSDTTSFGSSTVSTPETSELTAGIGQRLEQPWSVYVSNPTPFSSSIVSAEWLMNTVIRSKAV